MKQEIALLQVLKNDFEVILVVLGGESTNTGLSQRYLDCKTLFDYAFNNYSLKTLNEKMLF